MFWRLLVCGLIIQMTLEHSAAVSPDDNVNGQGCNEHGVCLPGAEDIAVPPRTITASNTCGINPPYEEYTPLGQTAVISCNSTSNEDNHPALFMIDRRNGFSTSNFETWWQSQTWWQWHDSKKQAPLVVNITISFNKSYVLTGDVRVTFKFNKPAKMVMEKSMNFGQTWEPLQYFADNCLERFQMEPSELNCSINGVLCSQKYRDHNEGPLYFSYLNCYTKHTFWNRKIQNTIEATDLRLRLEFPATDGVHGIVRKENLQKYFYAISDVQVFGRCQCNGHAPNCEFPEASNGAGYVNIPKCMCKHNTAGVNCERCEQLYNNKTWMPAKSLEEPNPCEKCNCHEHASSCTFNSSLEHGVCDHCQHNTTGYFCEQCQDKFYRNVSRELNDSLVCLDCNCALEGVTDNGSCSQMGSTIGQCQCKKNVTGRRCDRCEDAYYGYTLPPVGNCVACRCRGHGTINGSLNCNQTTGQCSCKTNTDLRTCSQCKLGFYNFPNKTDEDCLQCHCDHGGSTPDICEKQQGKCLCRYEIEGKKCSEVTGNRFFPSYKYFLYEAEYHPGNYSVTSNLTEYDKYFTGTGYAELKNNQHIMFEISVEVKSNFTLVLRYSEAVGRLHIWVKGNLTSLKCPEVNRNISTRRLQVNARGASWESSEKITLCPGTNYTIYIYTGDTNASVKVDSLMLVPELTKLRSYKYMSSLVTSCQANYTTIKGSMISESGCKNVTFSTMVELFNGSLACGCSVLGANSTTCNPYGGQCQCKQGVMGRTCDRCEPGYYNFTTDGCTPCECDALGSENFVCDQFTGQCLCRQAVEGRACDHCELHSYGIHTGQGCASCNCNTTGSINMTCDDVTGKCYCKPGIEDINTDKCDRCQVNYFNFTQDGCQACNCNEAGSRSLQCHSSGECPCKIKVNGTKCDRCIKGTFSLEKDNPSGCIPCFCFNRSNECSAAAGYILSHIKQSNLTIPTHGYAKLPRKFQGYQLHSYVRRFEVNITMSINISEIKVHLKGVSHKASFRLNTTYCDTPEVGRYCVFLHEEFAHEKLDANQMQSILADVNEATVNISGELGNGTEVSVAMATAIRGRNGDEANHVERCTCPKHYTELSCQNCNTGFTRDVANKTAFVSCVPCSCHNRSETCDPESGRCDDCYLSKGYNCETCVDGADINASCTKCLPTFWTPNIHKHERCIECNCVLNNTLNHNNSVCNATTGQCKCKSYVGGQRCDRCEENYYNTSHGCRKCAECYGLMKVYVHKLRDLIEEVDKTVKQLHSRFQAIGNNEFARRLSNAKNSVDNIYNKANLTASQDSNNLNITIDVLDMLSSSVTNLTTIVEELKRQERNLQLVVNKTSNWTKTAYGTLQRANESRPSIKNFRNAMKSLVQPLEQAREAMEKLNYTQWSVAQNLTTTTESQLQKISNVVAKAETVEENLNNNTNEINSLQNKTQATLNYGQDMKNASRNFSDVTNAVFDNSKDILKTVKHLTELIEENRNLTQKLNDEISSPSLENNSIQKNASNSLKESEIQTTKAEILLNTTELLLNEVNEIKENAINANESARSTLKDAIKTRGILDNFQNISTNVIKMANDSLQQISNIKAQSDQSIKQIMNVSKSVQDGLKSSEEGITLADEAYDLSWKENQAIGSVYNRSKILEDHHKNTVCSNDLMKNYRNNITARSNNLKTLLDSCPRQDASNTSAAAREALKQSKETKDDSVENYEDARNVYKEVLESKGKVENIENAVKSKSHETRVTSHAELFKELRDELKKLRKVKEKRAKVIEQWKEQVRTMKLEIKDLESLRESFQDVPSCALT